MLQMKYRTRIYYTEADKALMWDRWQRGESLRSVAIIPRFKGFSLARAGYARRGVDAQGGR